MEQISTLTLLEPAQTLEDVHRTLPPQPLLTPAEMHAFYRGDINNLRGGDKVADLAMGLEDSRGATFYKACLAGHPGVGKSTELTRLVETVSGRFRAIRFRVVEELDPINFKPFDILFLMMMRVVEETARPVNEGGAGKPLSESLLREIIDWFAQEQNIDAYRPMSEIEVSPDIGPHATSLWNRTASLFRILKGEMRFAASRSHKLIDHRLQRVSTLVDLINRVSEECNDSLRDASGCEWLFIGDDFDSSRIPTACNEKLFFNYSHMLNHVECHLVFTLPLDLVYSPRADQLPCPRGRIHILPDTPVFGPEHQDFRKGRAVLKETLAARVSPMLFVPSQMKRFIVASGGNLGDLFAMVRVAADHAILRGATGGKIGKLDADRAISKYRSLYKLRLGHDIPGPVVTTYGQKADRLVAIYQRNPEARIPDHVLDALLTTGVIQGFAGEHRFGVHPIVLDILKEQGRLSPN
jgi:hypothetical protein